MRNNVDEFTASDRVVHDVAMWAHPHCAVRNRNVSRHSIGLRHATPANATRKPRSIKSTHAVPHDRMDSIGTNYDVSLDLAAVSKARQRTSTTWLNRFAS
jgi:hypothetical protein